jgi:hypothetical protein
MSLPDWVMEACRWCRGTGRGTERHYRCEDCDGTGEIAICEGCDEQEEDCSCECSGCGMERAECICDEVSEEGEL